MFWTIQHKVVLDAINSDGIYKPDFSLSQKPYGFVGVYSFILNSFNLLNPQLEKRKGLVFSFDDAQERTLESVADVKKFFSNITRRSFICKSGVNEDVFENDDYFLLQLNNYSDEIYTLPLDISYFVYLSDCLDKSGRLLSYDYYEANEIIMNILTSWNQGNYFWKWMYPSTVSGIASKPSNIMQYHLPWIVASNIMKVFPIKDIR